jgi:hypothetical protein
MALRHALNELRRAADRFHFEAKEDGVATPRLRAQLSDVTRQAWLIEETIDQIEREV